MPIRITWVDEDKTLIRVRLGGRLASADFVAANVGFRAMLDSVTHPVDVIFDPRRQVYFAPGYFQTAQAVRMGDYANLRAVVFVGKTLAWELFVTYAQQYGGISYRYACVPTLSAAYRLIEQLRAGDVAGWPVPVPAPDWN